MTKFFRLIGNEWKKEFSKRAMWAMLILLLIITAFWSVLSGIDLGSSFFVYDLSFEESCREAIAWSEEMLTATGAKDDEESLHYYRMELEANRIMLDAGMDWEDWRYTLNLAYDAAEAKLAGDTESYAVLMDVIESHDAGKYFSMLKGNYEARYADDPERRAIYTETMEYCIAQGVIPSDSEDWRYAQVEILIQNRETVLAQERLRDAGGAWSEKTLEAAQNAAAVASYRLEHDISLNPADSFEQNEYEMYFSDVSVYTSAKSSFWNAAVGSVSLLALVGVFAIVLAGTTVSSEFSSGTVKFLLMSPVKRWKILFAKYATVIFISLGMAALVGTVSLSVALFFGFGEAFLPAVYASGGEVYTLSPYLLLLRDYGFEMVEITVMLTMAFAISTLTRKSAMAIGVTVFASFMGSALSGFLQMFGIDAGRYLLFSNLDLGAIVNETALYPHQSLLEAITVIALHMLVFLLVAHDAFVRREV